MPSVLLYSDDLCISATASNGVYTLYKRQEMSQTTIILIITLICIIILFILIMFGCWPDLTRKSLYCQCWGSLFQNSSQTSTSDNVDGFDAQIANRRDQEHRQILEQLGFDPNLEADGYIAPSNTVNSMDCSLLNQRSPSIAYNEVKDKTVPGLIENCECSICMCEMEDTDKVRLLACKHAFHVKCIDPWILHCKSVCPLCRQNVLD